MWHMTHDWHVTHDMWQITCYKWHVTHGMWHKTHDRWGRWTFSKNVSFLAFTVLVWKCFEDIFTQIQMCPQAYFVPNYRAYYSNDKVRDHILGFGLWVWLLLRLNSCSPLAPYKGFLFLRPQQVLFSQSNELGIFQHNKWMFLARQEVLFQYNMWQFTRALSIFTYFSCKWCGVIKIWERFFQRRMFCHVNIFPNMESI